MMKLYIKAEFCILRQQIDQKNVNRHSLPY